MQTDAIFDVLKQQIYDISPEWETQGLSREDSLKALGANSVDRAEILMMTMSALKLKVPIMRPRVICLKWVLGYKYCVKACFSRHGRISFTTYTSTLTASNQSMKKPELNFKRNISNAVLLRCDQRPKRITKKINRRYLPKRSDIQKVKWP